MLARTVRVPLLQAGRGAPGDPAAHTCLSSRRPDRWMWTLVHRCNVVQVKALTGDRSRPILPMRTPCPAAAPCGAVPSRSFVGRARSWGCSRKPRRPRIMPRSVPGTRPNKRRNGLPARPTGPRARSTGGRAVRVTRCGRRLGRRASLPGSWARRQVMPSATPPPPFPIQRTRRMPETPPSVG